ncbi:MAG: hypothetical protein MUO31_06890 [Thermodesulfovibrionales bacterium]|nr:hypothetical protein [Thermodesulfovibrionales bacterium]
MKLEELTALYSPLDIEYAQVMSGPYEDLSFHDGDTKVVAGLKDGRISGFWRPVVAVGDDKDLKLHIERLYDICPNIYYMDFLIDGRLSVISQFLLERGHKARPYFTQIIDLTKTEEELHADLRKSYKSLVNKGFGGIDTALGVLRKLHKDTRSNETWHIQSKIIGMQQAFISDDEGKSACLIYHNRYTAYYFSGVSEDGVNSHPCLWMAILQAKALGCKTFEMGEQVFDGDPKLVNISKFKRGFGGKTVTRIILEKDTK